MAAMRQLGCSESFVLPKNEAEFAGLRADLGIANANRLRRKLTELERERAQRRGHITERLREDEGSDEVEGGAGSVGKGKDVDKAETRTEAKDKMEAEDKMQAEDKIEAEDKEIADADPVIDVLPTRPLTTGHASLSSLNASAAAFKPRAAIKVPEVGRSRLEVDGHVTVRPAFGGKVTLDGLSPVLALPSSFNPYWTSSGVPFNDFIDWPSKQEYTQEGHDRIHLWERGRRFLPVPRRNTVDDRAWQEAGFPPLNQDHDQSQNRKIPWRMRQMVGDRWHLNLLVPIWERQDMNPLEEIMAEDAPSHIRDFVIGTDEQLELDI